jgi:hypothetical protein
MKDKGLGDTVERIFKIVYPKGSACEMCIKRKDRLNKLFPYGRKK